jgi:hypothetical protein
MRNPRASHSHRTIASALITSDAEYHPTDSGYRLRGSSARDDVEISVDGNGAADIASRRNGLVGSVSNPAVAARLAIAMARSPAAPRL